MKHREAMKRNKKPDPKKKKGPEKESKKVEDPPKAAADTNVAPSPRSPNSPLAAGKPAFASVG